MKEANAIQALVEIIHHLHDGLVDFNESRRRAYALFQSEDDNQDENAFNSAFPILVEYFFDPVKKAGTILKEKDISRECLLASHRFVRESRLARKMFLSNRYPRSLLAKSASILLGFMGQNPRYLPKILHGEAAGPMMLEIHPTNAMCVYRCKMCIWCGGQKKKTPISDFYGKEQLLTVDKWLEILDEAKSLGTVQIIFSGGGETLFTPTKVKPILDKANSAGFETMIYTNGRMLCDADSALLDSILSSTWLRVSLHAATPEIYSKLINRPLGANDLKFVLLGMRRVIDLKKARGGILKVGIGVVLQESNYAEVAKISKLCSDLCVDFLDVRVDCIGITHKLSKHQYGHMLSSLRELRDSAENGLIGFNVSFSDDLLIAMDRWTRVELTRPSRCLIPVVRPAIDPFGVVGACDSIGEPYTRSKSPREYVLGHVGDGCSFTSIMRNSASKELGVHCKFCMPGQISLNALLEKLVEDLRMGINPADQPFCFNANLKT